MEKKCDKKYRKSTIFGKKFFSSLVQPSKPLHSNEFRKKLILAFEVNSVRLPLNCTFFLNFSPRFSLVYTTIYWLQRVGILLWYCCKILIRHRQEERRCLKVITAERSFISNIYPRRDVTPPRFFNRGYGKNAAHRITLLLLLLMLLLFDNS